MKKLAYLNNFPREGALLGDLFDGGADLKEELLGRGIIGEVEVTKEAKVVKDGKALAELQAENEKLQAENEKLKAESGGDFAELKEKVDAIDTSLTKPDLVKAIEELKA